MLPCFLDVSGCGNLSLSSLHFLAVQECKFSSAPSKTHVLPCSGGRLAVNWETFKTVTTTVRGRFLNEWVGQMSLSVWHLNKRGVVEESCKKGFAGYFTRVMSCKQNK